MFILQNENLYIQNKEDIIGVNVSVDNVESVTGTETKLGEHELLSATEMKCRFNISEQTPYKFPIKKEVKKDDTTSKVKKKVTKSK